MKLWKKLVFGAVLLIGLCLFTTTTVAYAEQAPIRDTEVSDQTQTYNLDSYGSQMVSEEGWASFFNIDTGQWINSGANIFFEFNKISFSVFRKGIELFGEASVLQDNISTFTSYSKNLFDTLYGKFGLTIIVCMAVYIFYLYFAKSPQRAMKQFVAFLMVIVFAFGWNAKGKDLVKGFNTISNEVQVALLQSTANNQGNTKVDATVLVQNTLFDLAVKEPYYLMNYGKTTNINTPENPKKTSEFLYSGNPTKDKLDTVQKSVNEAAEKNEYLQPSKAGWKLAVGFLSPIMTISIGFPLLAIQFLNFMVELIALVVSGFIGLSAFISLIPKFQNAVWKMMQFLLGAFGIRVLLGLAFLMLVSVINVIRTAIPSDGISNYALQVLAISVVIFFIWKNRDKIVYMITGGVVASLDKGILNKATKPVKDGVKSGAKYAGDIAGLATVGVPLGSSIGQAGAQLSDYTKENAQGIYEDRIARKQERNSGDFVMDSGRKSGESSMNQGFAATRSSFVIPDETREANQNNEEKKTALEPLIAFNPASSSDPKLGEVSDTLNDIESKMLSEVPDSSSHETSDTKSRESKENRFLEDLADDQNASVNQSNRSKYQLDSPRELGVMKDQVALSSAPVDNTNQIDVPLENQTTSQLSIEDMVLSEQSQVLSEGQNEHFQSPIIHSDQSINPELTTVSNDQYSLYSTENSSEAVSVTNEFETTRTVRETLQSDSNSIREIPEQLKSTSERSMDNFDFGFSGGLE